MKRKAGPKNFYRIDRPAQLDAPSNEMLQRVMTHLNLSARAYERIIKERTYKQTISLSL